MRTLPAATWGRLLPLLDEGVFAWTVMLQVDALSALYLTTHQTALSYRGETWSPWPMEVGPFTDADGDLSSSSISLSNVGRVAMPYLEARTWRGRRATLQLVAADAPDALPAVLRLDFSILGATATRSTVTLSLGQANFLSRQYPGRRFIRAQGFPGIIRNIA